VCERYKGNDFGFNGARTKAGLEPLS
jgi:hypothetical protein